MLSCRGLVHSAQALSWRFLSAQEVAREKMGWFDHLSNQHSYAHDPGYESNLGPKGAHNSTHFGRQFGSEPNHVIFLDTAL